MFEIIIRTLHKKKPWNPTVIFKSVLIDFDKEGTSFYFWKYETER